MNTKNYKKILPIFGNPVIKKDKIDALKSKYNLEIITANSKYRSLIEVLTIYLKNLNKYSKNFQYFIIIK